jgi:hypothetical protein
MKPCTYCGQRCRGVYNGIPYCWCHHPEKIQRRKEYEKYYNAHRRYASDDEPVAIPELISDIDHGLNTTWTRKSNHAILLPS